MPALGVKLDGLPTEEIAPLTRLAEQHGLDEVWVCEDLGRNGGIAQSGIALAVTERVRVGHGIAPAAIRNVAYYAMEVASLARAFPARFHAGIGHGEPWWLRQVGAHPGRLLPCLAETTEAARRLLRGETVSLDGRWVHLEDVALDWPPEVVPPISLGVRGPKGMAIAAEQADGVILAEGSSPDYVRGAVGRLGRPDHRVTVFSWLSIGDTSSGAREALRDVVAAALERESMATQLGPLAGGPASDDAVAQLTVSGTADECLEAIAALGRAGADAVVLQPIPGTEREQLPRLAEIVAGSGRSGP